MAKPIVITAVQGGYTVHVDPEAARLYGAKKRKKPCAGYVCKVPGGQGLNLFTDVEPAVLDLDTAKSIAHQVGRYMMGFGDMVFAYTDAPKGTWEE